VPSYCHLTMGVARSDDVIAQEERPLDSNYTPLIRTSIFRNQFVSRVQLPPVRSTKASFSFWLTQVAESRCGYRGSNKPVFVERDSLGKEQVLQSSLPDATAPAVRDLPVWPL
jgi:hypothetical protein